MPRPCTSPAEVTPQPVDFDKIGFTAGSGDKFASVVIQFNDGQGPENLVYGYRWSGGWDDSFATVLQNIANADKRMTVTTAGNKFAITYDSDHDGKLGTNDHTSTAGEWTCYVKRVIDDGFEKSQRRPLAQPPAQCSCWPTMWPTWPSSNFPTCSIAPPSIRANPHHARERGICPRRRRPPSSRSSSSVRPRARWRSPFPARLEISAVTGNCQFSRYMGRLNGYKNFKPVTGNIKARVYYTPAEGYESLCILQRVRRDPPKPRASRHRIGLSRGRCRRTPQPQRRQSIQIIPADATYTKLSYTSSNSRVATVNATTGVVKTTTTAGEAVISAAYSLDAEIAASYSLTSELNVKADDVTFDCVGPDGAITLTPKEMSGLVPVFTPADPDLNTVTVKLRGQRYGQGRLYSHDLHGEPLGRRQQHDQSTRTLGPPRRHVQAHGQDRRRSYQGVYGQCGRPRARRRNRLQHRHHHAQRGVVRAHQRRPQLDFARI